MKTFDESLKDGFEHITEINNPELLKQLREDGVQVDSEGYYSCSFGEHKEYELCFEPLPEEGQYRIVVYKNRVSITVPVPVWENKTDQ